MLRLVLTAIGCVSFVFSKAQFSISGTVKDVNSDPLVGATVQADPGGYYAVSNDRGEYVISNVPAGEYILTVRFLGFEEEQRNVMISNDLKLDFILREDVRITEEVIVLATRASEKSPTTYSNLNKTEIRKQNFGQDLPYMLNWTPSLVTTSDAGAGVGYTGLRIRGSDATRINVTINGIPYNDSESQGVFWVDIPDIATSTQSIQLQRGVGTSTNGAGAFGATINLQTTNRNDAPYSEVITSAGSFNTRRVTTGFGSGLINDRFIFDGRVSLIHSDGYIDRASSDLKSYYFSGGYYGEKTIVKAIAFGGKEITYQSWWGVPESRLNNDVAAMQITAATEGWDAEQTANLLNSGRTFNIYDYKDQVDDYSQSHFQLHLSNRFNESVTGNISLHYTPGRGYYEEYKRDQTFSDYGLPDFTIGAETISTTDLIRRRWLDNDFYGVTFSANYELGKLEGVVGGAWNRYEGDHFGEIIWAEVAANTPKDYRYYFNKGDKKDFNIYWKNSYEITNRLNGFIDLQYRRVDYAAAGIENDLNPFNVLTKHDFFNPKVGLVYDLRNNRQFYASYSIGRREPVRDDFINANPGQSPKSEKLKNIEAGIRIKKSNYFFNANYYLMDYDNQLVLTGALNDVGAAIRTNVDKSYRMGIELEGAVRLNRKFTWGANATLSESKIKNFTEVLYDYGVNFDEFNEVQNSFTDVDIAFSPELIVGSTFTFNPIKGLEASLLSKYVGDQFLDNTSNENRKIDAYFINDLRFGYETSVGVFKELKFSFLINNVFDVAYESNGYTYGFIGGGEINRQNYYYPQAGRNFMVMASFRIQ